MKTCSAVYSVTLFAFLVCVSQAQAAFDGSPVSGPGSASDSLPNNVWTSTLIPNPAINQASCPWIANGLAAQGFVASNGWTINYKTLSGGLSLESYYAWVTDQPTNTIHSVAFGGNSHGADWGGADIRLLYTPGVGDPTGSSVHWIQAILTDSALNAGAITNAYDASSTYGAGYYEYLDNSGTYRLNPDYDNNIPTTNSNPTTSTEFLDIPSRYQAPTGTIHWQAQAFIDTFDSTTKTVDIYGSGVWWGFNLTATVPEPSAGALTVAGLCVAWARARRRKRRPPERSR
jgi:hypothetical protein